VVGIAVLHNEIVKGGGRLGGFTRVYTGFGAILSGTWLAFMARRDFS
jgi:hypothetical protein